jgi:hypothetical protein
MSLVRQHFDALRAKPRYAGASLDEVPNGTFLVTIAGYPLPPGWNRDTTTIYFIVPVGYPQAKPDSFWTDPGLLLASGAMPQNATLGGNQQPGLPSGVLWFSWHVNNWNPNSDTLETYANLIRGRLQVAR